MWWEGDFLAVPRAPGERAEMCRKKEGSTAKGSVGDGLHFLEKRGDFNADHHYCSFLSLLVGDERSMVVRQKSRTRRSAD
jgi:hypothetical protein